MYILTGLVGMLIFGAFTAWVDVWMLGGFILGALVYGIYYMIKNSKSNGNGNGSDLGGCLIFAILAGIFEGL